MTTPRASSGMRPAEVGRSRASSCPTARVTVVSRTAGRGRGGETRAAAYVTGRAPRSRRARPVRPPPPSAALRASAQQRVDEVGAEADLLVVLLADLDVVVHVEEVDGVAVLVEPDERAPDLEVDLHRLVGLVGDERVRLARRLVDEVAGRRDPVVLEVPPLARDGVREDLVRVVVAVDEAGTL